MLQQKNRLRRMKDFDILFKEGRFVGGSLVTLKLWWIDPDKFPRRAYTKDEIKIAVIVSKKVHKSAVKRNKIKRQIREVIRLLLLEDKLKHGALVSVMATPKSFGATYQDIEASVIDTLTRAKLMK